MHTTELLPLLLTAVSIIHRTYPKGGKVYKPVYTKKKTANLGEFLLLQNRLKDNNKRSEPKLFLKKDRYRHENGFSMLVHTNAPSSLTFIQS